MASEETRISDQIRLAMSETCVLARSPAGFLYQGKRVGNTLTNLRPTKVLVPGCPDLTGFRRSDGKAVFIEVKTAKGRPSAELEKMQEIAGGAHDAG